MPSFSTRPIVINQTVGERLQKVRAGAGLDLSEVARHIGVKREFLHYIENGQYNDLPGDIYAIEFIKKYARFFSVDYSEIVAEYYRERSEHGSRQRVRLWRRLPKLYRASNVALRKIAVWSGTIAAASFMLAAIGWQLVNYFTFGPKLEIFSPISYYKTPDSKVILSGRVAPDGRLWINGQAVRLSPAGDWQEVVNLPPGQTLLKILAKSARGREQTVYRSLEIKGGSGQVAGASVEKEGTRRTIDKALD